jgi:hypothetical protein
MMENRLPTGPGSRGGKWHNAEYRREYHRAWRLAHPEYRERERLRRARKRAQDIGLDPADIVVLATFPRPLPLPTNSCGCTCLCTEPIVSICGFCRDDIHGEKEA